VIGTHCAPVMLAALPDLNDTVTAKKMWKVADVTLRIYLERIMRIGMG
jgi:hypothetical protein